jgi:hypothetical protein
MGIEFLMMVTGIGAFAGVAAKTRWRKLDSRIPVCECGHPRFEHDKRQGGCKCPNCRCDTYAELGAAQLELPEAIAGELMG